LVSSASVEALAALKVASSAFVVACSASIFALLAISCCCFVSALTSSAFASALLFSLAD